MTNIVVLYALLLLTALDLYSQQQDVPEPGSAHIWYLGHCGYAVRTPKHLLIFDYQERRDGAQPKVRPSPISLSDGWINPEDIKDLTVRVFVSHSHDDHYDPIILSWQKIIPDIEYYFGWNAAEIPSSHYFIGPRTELTSDDLEISTINSHHSGVPEVAWLVKVDGLIIYHNGDCQPDNFADEYDFLRKKTDQIDLAFVMPVYEEHERYAKQNNDLFEKFNPRAVFPMHAKAGAKLYADFKKAFESKLSGLSIFIPGRMGERFVLRSGGIQKEDLLPSQKYFPELTGSYLGQNPPGMIPVIFAPEILSTDKYPHGHLSFSNDGKTICWSAYPKGKTNQTIFFSALAGKNLTFPLKAPFAADSGNGGPAISYDGKRLYFSAELSSVNSASRKPFAICYVERVEEDWSKPIIIESTVDTLITKGQVSIAKSGNIYFTGRVYSERVPSIFVCRKKGDKFLPPEKVKGKLAEAGLISDPWVDPEERFMLLSIQPEQGPPMRTDIGISYRESDNTWSKPVRMKGEINTNHFERFPSLSPDGKYLFFIRSTSERFVGEGAHFYWVSSISVEMLRPNE